MSSTTRNQNAVHADVYPTPHWAIESILREIDWNQVYATLDPACGDRRISIAIRRHAIDTVSGDITEGQDYRDFEYEEAILSIRNAGHCWIEIHDTPALDRVKVFNRHESKYAQSFNRYEPEWVTEPIPSICLPLYRDTSLFLSKIARGKSTLYLSLIIVYYSKSNER